MALGTEPKDEFEVARGRAQQQVASGVQQQKDALKRRFSALGSLNSGAAIKQEQLAEQAGQEQLQKANEGIDAAQNQELKRVREVKEARDFARGEREAGQSFAAQQAELGRGFMQTESEKARGFTADQSRLARELQSSQFATSMQRDWEKFQHEKYIDGKNLEMADRVLSQKDVLEQMLGGLPGFIGGGVGKILGSGGTIGGGIVGSVLGPVGTVGGAVIGGGKKYF